MDIGGTSKRSYFTLDFRKNILNMDNAQEKTEVTTVHEEPATVVKTTKKVTPAVKTEHPQVVYNKKKALFRTYQIIWYILGIIEVLLAFRFALKMLGANPASGFANMIYAITTPLAAPFQGILGTTPVTTGSFFEWTTLLAAIVYAIIAAGIVQMLQFFKPTDPEEVSSVVDSQ